MSKYSIVIATVNFDCPGLLSLNLKNIGVTNPDLDIKVVVTNNAKYTPNFTLPNVSFAHLPGVERSTCVITPDMGLPKKYWGRVKPGIHHGRALDKAVSHAESLAPDFLIIVEQDFIFIPELTPILDYMLSESIDVVGAPYAWGGWHENIKMFDVSNVAHVPSCFFSVFNAKTVKNLKIDMTNRNKNYKEEWLDTSITVRERMHSFKYEVFNVCIKENCSICNEVLPKLNYDKFGFMFERFFYQHKLCGLHFHAKSTNNFKHGAELCSKLDTILRYEDLRNDINHPYNNFLIPPNKEKLFSNGRGINGI